jgi:hypothetical protein
MVAAFSPGLTGEAMKASISMIASRVKAYSHGLMEDAMKEVG